MQQEARKNKRRVRSKAIHLNRPPRHKLHKRFRPVSGSRGEIHLEISEVRAFPCIAQWRTANFLLAYRCGGSVGILHEQAPTSRLILRTTARKTPKAIARTEYRLRLIKLQAEAESVSRESPGAPLTVASIFSLAFQFTPQSNVVRKSNQQRESRENA